MRCVVLIAVVAAGCGRPPATSLIDAAIAAEIAGIRAIDHHAHPVRVLGPGEQDREFDALPVDNMEPSSDPLFLRPGAPGVSDASRALFGAGGKQRMMREKGDGYPAWVLDQMGVEVMIANRVRMGRGVQPPRFLWAPYADALLFPLNNAGLAARNSDRKAFFKYEDTLLRSYMPELPASLDDYLARVVIPTLEQHKSGGAVAEKFEAAYLRSLDFDKVDRTSCDAGLCAVCRQERTTGRRIQAAAGLFVPLRSGRVRPIAHGGASAHDGRGRQLLRRARGEPSAARIRS